MYHNHSGLFRYLIGDTIQFTSIKPHLFKITGRTASHINAFGEELMVWNTDEAIRRTSINTKLRSGISCCSLLFSLKMGRHDWAIEFEKEPLQLQQFINDLDFHLQDINLTMPQNDIRSSFKKVTFMSYLKEVLTSGYAKKDDWRTSKDQPIE